ncbi:hypothetical protein FHX34_106359 [Actinoplanes teichomyceticus]|uniref:Uncharacterized protein n=1 Tax=Actinoplanes teichomyceticus TaxID=1867 RepID=A0A561VJ45_ACTTI|nr:hypothetical protein FHX34_106359 [Actinoplanes teichomyceticus]
MRDRTASRDYSPAREEFRREHERRRFWGLRRRHAERLRRGGAASSITPTGEGERTGPVVSAASAGVPAVSRVVPVPVPVPGAGIPAVSPVGPAPVSRAEFRRAWQVALVRVPGVWQVALVRVPGVRQAASVRVLAVWQPAPARVSPASGSGPRVTASGSTPAFPVVGPAAAGKWMPAAPTWVSAALLLVPASSKQVSAALMWVPGASVMAPAVRAAANPVPPRPARPSRASAPMPRLALRPLGATSRSAASGVAARSREPRPVPGAWSVAGPACAPGAWTVAGPASGAGLPGGVGRCGMAIAVTPSDIRCRRVRGGRGVAAGVAKSEIAEFRRGPLFRPFMVSAGLPGLRSRIVHRAHGPPASCGFDSTNGVRKPLSRAGVFVACRIGPMGTVAMTPCSACRCTGF